MTDIYSLMLAGQFREPFLEPALRSTDWVDHVVFVNTAPGTLEGDDNELVVRNVVQPEKLTVLSYIENGHFDFAAARELGMQAIPNGAYVLIVDSDDVHWDEFENVCQDAIVNGYDMVSVLYYHLAVYKDLLHSQKRREILFKKTPETRFENTEGTVHEVLVHPREHRVEINNYSYDHFGYIKESRDVAARWEFYRSLGAQIHDYDVSEPDRALDDWPRICTPHWHEHPPAALAVLENFPSAPKLAKETPRVGLVLLTWNDADLLKTCLPSLATTYEPFKLCVVDNGSDDDTQSMLDKLHDQSESGEWACGPVLLELCPGLSLAEALNVGFGKFMEDPEIQYVGWIHPDHTFEWPDWLGVLVKQMDEHPEWAKLGCNEAQEHAGLRPGNSQCFIIRRSALEEVGLFDEGFVGIGGREDFDHNKRLLKVGKVMITPDARVRHIGMATRSRRDTNGEAITNANYYFSKWGTYDQFV